MNILLNGFPDLEFKKISCRTIRKFDGVFIECRPKWIQDNIDDDSRITRKKVAISWQDEDRIAYLETFHHGAFQKR